MLSPKCPQRMVVLIVHFFLLPRCRSPVPTLVDHNGGCIIQFSAATAWNSYQLSRPKGISWVARLAAREFRPREPTGTMSKERHAPLVEALEIRGDGLGARAKQLIERAHQISPMAPSSFPSGTDHTPTHTITVEKIAGWFLGRKLLKELSDEELLLLTLACHYHDLGMVGTVEDDANDQSRAQVRREHSLSVGERLRQDWTAFGFEHQRQAEILAEICRGHRPSRHEGVAHWDDLDEVMVLQPGVNIRIRLVSAMVYAADELHIGADRAPERVEHYREIKNEESRRHWFRHRCIFGPSLRDDQLFFQVKALTPVVEEDLRSRVLMKAFSARVDLVTQLKKEGIDLPPAEIRIEWMRDEMWRKLLVAASADLIPRKTEELAEEVLKI